MCYSAKVWTDYRKYVKKFGARMDIHEFVHLLERRVQGVKVNIPVEVTDIFKLDAHSPEELHCRELILRFDAEEASRLEEQLFQQRRRLADAERILAGRHTKAAAESRRIATNKVAWLSAKLADLKRAPGQAAEARIYPGSFCPVLVMDKSGDYLIKPMRYQCRPAGKPAAYDGKFPGTYNARRDNLQGFWKAQYGATHALIVASAFYEHVSRHRLEGRDLAEGETAENVILQFTPGDGQLMHVACLWSHWKGNAGENDLLSFAAITDEPPQEVSAAGHDRCIIPLKDENLARWLAASSTSLAEYEAMLDDRQRPYYTHLLAA